MKVEIWSDYICPFCYIGKRYFDEALSQFPNKDKVEVIYRSFELSPDAAYEPGVSMAELLAAKYGMSIEEAEANNAHITEQAANAGLEYHLDRVVPANTFNAHRLVHFAAEQGKMKEMAEALFQAYFTDTKNLDDQEVLVELAAGAGLNRDEAKAVLESDQYGTSVRADEDAARRIGVQGVPFFVLDGKYAVSGAQPVEVFVQALQKAFGEEKPLILVNDEQSGGGACTDGACDIPSK